MDGSRIIKRSWFLKAFVFAFGFSQVFAFAYACIHIKHLLNS
mgnify:CR=1 FL=1